MATLASPPAQVVCLAGSWRLYCELLEAQGDDGDQRISTDGDVIEIMSPNFPHDEYAGFLGRLVYEVRREWGIRLSSAGTTTIQAAPKVRSQTKATTSLREAPCPISSSS